MSCEHDTPRPHRVCRHLLEREQPNHVRFVGVGRELLVVCATCATLELAAIEVIAACDACHARAGAGGWEGIVGRPAIAERATAARFTHLDVPIATAFVDVQPLRGPPGDDRARWIGLAADGGLHRWDADRGTLDLRASVAASVDVGDLDLAQPITMRIARDGQLAAIANRHGLAAIVVDLATWQTLHRLERDGAEPEHCAYALAFVEHGGRTLLVHAPAWNRLDAIDARTGELRTARGPTTAGPDDATPPLHDLDYFHGGLEASPDDRWIVDNGWVWHPVGIVTVFSVDAWLDGNVWETEDGPTRRELVSRLYHWDKPVCWLDDHHLAIAGYGDDDAWLLPDAVRIFDVRTGVEERWFPGPHGELVADRLLFALGDPGLAAWDPLDGARLAHAPDARPHRYHPDAKVFTSLPTAGRATLTRLVGLDAALGHGVVRDLATTIARDRSFHELPVLGDALEASGCTDAAMLAHCHAGGDHGDRCWVIDRLLAS